MVNHNAQRLETNVGVGRECYIPMGPPRPSAPVNYVCHAGTIIQLAPSGLATSTESTESGGQLRAITLFLPGAPAVSPIVLPVEYLHNTTAQSSVMLSKATLRTPQHTSLLCSTTLQHIDT
jgi:hypothetical protein